MGGGKWDSDTYRSSSTKRKASGIDDFQHSVDVKSGKVSGIHESLDPTWVAGPTSSLAGMHVWESRDSDEHPESLPIAVFFDVTGSMGRIPKILQQKLAKLMDVVLDKAGVPHPQVLVGGIGDSTCDRYPFQVGQFETDNRFDEALRSVILEGGGGGQRHESYGLAYYWGAHFTTTDSVEKRGKRGYLFTMGDESFWPQLKGQDLQNIFGIDNAEGTSVQNLIPRLQENWEVFHLIIAEGHHGGEQSIRDDWHQLLGERATVVEQNDLVCEVIAGLIYGCEQAAGIDQIVSDLGLNAAASAVVSTALAPLRSGGIVAGTADGSLPKRSTTAGGVTRV